jgi:TonB-linked SusC/RagA family outer membrane protein
MPKREILNCFLKMPFERGKIMRIMRTTTLILLVLSIHLSVFAHGQDKITVILRNTIWSKALVAVEKASSYRFVYSNDLAPVNKKIDLVVRDADLPEVMDKLLVSTSLSYKVMPGQVVVLFSKTETTPEIKVSGRITDENGAPLAGASVRVRSSSQGVSANANGEYTITVPDDAVLIFSYVGYAERQISVSGQSTINVSLQPSAKVQDQVVVVGYGTQRKIDVTGSVSQVKGEDINKQPSPNPISSLQGKVAGVQITNSGAPGSSPEIRIRGLGTVYGSATPLYVVDGVWFNDISFLNPADIETINILKDASSESIYGIRAANGVVLVTTKKGRGNKPTVNYNGYVGWQKVTNEVEMANGQQYATMVNELRVINGSPALLKPSDYSTGTDWYHQILRDALINNHQVSVSGGSGNGNNYNFSLGYLNQDGIVEKNNYTRYTARLQNDIQIASPLKIGYVVTGAYSSSKDIPGGIFHEMYSAAPIVPVYYADGTYGDPSDYNLGGAVTFNPQVTLDIYNQKSKNYRLNGSAYANLKFLKHFAFNSSIGGDFGQAEVRNYLPAYTATLTQRNANSSLSISRGETRNWILENTLTYQNRFDDHRITILAGQAAQRYKFYSVSASAPNVPNNSEGDLYLRLGTAANITTIDAGDLSTVASYFGRVNYSFKNRYLVNASIRADGSSKFSGGDRWGYFPSVGVGWVVTEEDFMKDQQIFNNLKIRGSWGRIGNASVPSNTSTLLVSQDAYLTAFFGNPSVAYTGATINKIVPPTTVWEKSEGTDVAIEMSLLKSRLYVEADWYNRKTLDAIFDIPILNSLGTTSGTIVGNQATIQNRGIEFTATWKDVFNKDLSYSVSANIGINDNKVLSTSTGANPIYSGGQGITGGALSTRTIVGRPIGEFYGLQVAGIFQNGAQVAGSAQAASAKAGDFIYVDQNKDGVIDGKDRIGLGNPNPKYAYGINTNWIYKNFDLTLDFQGVAGVKVYDANLGFRFGNENFTKDFYENRWHGEGTSNFYPSANIGGGNNYLPNSFYVEDGSYFRIRNMQLGYTLPISIAQKIKAKSFRVYVNAQNAFNFFKYRGFSPEISGGNPTGRGIDVSVYPLSATYNFGLNISF